jgi:hypothetical protein
MLGFVARSEKLKKEWDNLEAVEKVIVGAVAAPYVAVAAAHFVAALPTYAAYDAFAAVTEPLIDAVRTKLKPKSQK